MYNDRINTYRRMREIDELLDSTPSPALVQEMAELRIRNLQSFQELERYNGTGNWIGKHPFASQLGERAELVELYRKDPSEFIRLSGRTASEIRRYESYLRSEKRANRRDKDKELLGKHLSRFSLMQSIMQAEK